MTWTDLHFIGKAVWYAGLGVNDLVHERLSETGVVQLIMAPGGVCGGND